MKDNNYSLTPLVYLHILANDSLALPSRLQEYRYAYTLTVHTEEYPKFILAAIIFYVLHPIPNNQLEFQLVSPSQEIFGHCFDLFTTVVTESWTQSQSRN